MKICAKCKQNKEDYCFSRGRQSRDGLQSYCKPCTAQANRDWKFAKTGRKVLPRTNKIDLFDGVMECGRCKEIKPLIEFSKRSDRPCGKNTVCKACVRKTNKNWYDANYHRISKDEEWRIGRIEKTRKKRYNIEVGQFDELMKSQGGVCAICKKPSSDNKNLHVDHDHQTGKIRGLLCAGCNMGIGNLKDDAILVRKAAEYLEARAA